MLCYAVLCCVVCYVVCCVMLLSKLSCAILIQSMTVKELNFRGQISLKHFECLLLHGIEYLCPSKIHMLKP
jgi:hypothetical protein